MRSYRIQLEPSDGKQVRATAEVEAWHPGLRSWAWLPITTWSVAVDDEVASSVERSLDEHGWRLLPGSTIRVPGLVPVQVRSYEQLVTTVAARRAEMAAEQAAVEALTHNIVSDVPPSGANGHIGATELAKMLGFTRVRIYQIAKTLAESLTSTPGAAADRAKLTATELKALQSKS